MKVIELIQTLSTMNPTAELILERDSEPLGVKVTLSTQLMRARDYIYWLNNRMEELKVIPTIGALIKFKSRAKGHQWQYGKFFELQVVSHSYEYLPGYGDYPGRWEVTVELSYPPANYQSLAEWIAFMDHNGY